MEELQRQLGSAAHTVPVHEPHLSAGDSHVAIEYVGFQANRVMACLFGEDWQGQGRTIEFRALDGFVSRVEVRRFAEESVYLVFAPQDGAPFTVDNVEQNQISVPLGPSYLVWDKISSPALMLEGTRNWPNQVREVRLVTLADEALVPAGINAGFLEGAELVRTHCLSCHNGDGFGGRSSKATSRRLTRNTGRRNSRTWS